MSRPNKTRTDLLAGLRSEAKRPARQDNVAHGALAYLVGWLRDSEPELAAEFERLCKEDIHGRREAA